MVKSRSNLSGRCRCDTAVHLDEAMPLKTNRQRDNLISSTCTKEYLPVNMTPHSFVVAKPVLCSLAFCILCEISCTTCLAAQKACRPYFAGKQRSLGCYYVHEVSGTVSVNARGGKCSCRRTRTSVQGAPSAGLEATSCTLQLTAALILKGSLMPRTSDCPRR